MHCSTMIVLGCILSLYMATYTTVPDFRWGVDWLCDEQLQCIGTHAAILQQVSMSYVATAVTTQQQVQVEVLPLVCGLFGSCSSSLCMTSAIASAN
jgi:hypothetical protein